MVEPIVLASTNNADKVKEITEKLESGVAELFDSASYQNYLKFLGKFHNYSFRNTLLIMFQGGELVAGYKTWQKMGRNVKKGERGIKIIAPAPFKKTVKRMKLVDGVLTENEEEVKVPAYKVTTVFDVSQTEGVELPECPAKELVGDVENVVEVFKALEEIAPVPIVWENITNGSNGYFSAMKGKIAIKEGMPAAQTIKTIIHEIAHSIFHANGEVKDKRTKEVQAESVAYTVCNYYGLDTSDYSFGYIADWSRGKEMTELKESLEIIRNTAHDLIEKIDGKLFTKEII